MTELDSSKYRELTPTPAEIKNIKNCYDNPLGQIGNIVFSPKALPYMEEDGYEIKTTFTHGEQTTIEGRAYFAGKIEDMLKKINPNAAYKNFQFEAKMYNSSGKEVSNKFIDEIKVGEGQWATFDQARIKIFPSEYCKVYSPRGCDEQFLEFVEYLPKDTYEVRCTYWLVAAPDTYEKEVWDEEIGKHIKIRAYYDPKWYILSAGNFNYIMPDGWTPKKGAGTEKQEEKKQEEKGLKGKFGKGFGKFKKKFF